MEEEAEDEGAPVNAVGCRGAGLRLMSSTSIAVVAKLAEGSVLDRLEGESTAPRRWLPSASSSFILAAGSVSLDSTRPKSSSLELPASKGDLLPGALLGQGKPLAGREAEGEGGSESIAMAPMEGR